MSAIPTLATIQQARARIAGYVRHTPLLPAPACAAICPRSYA